MKRPNHRPPHPAIELARLLGLYLANRELSGISEREWCEMRTDPRRNKTMLAFLELGRRVHSHLPDPAEANAAQVRANTVEPDALRKRLRKAKKLAATDTQFAQEVEDQRQMWLLAKRQKAPEA